MPSPLGPLGEQIARKYLEERGYQFIEANYRTRFGEIDLIMRDGDQTVFVEVKTRHVGNKATSNMGLPGYKLDRMEAALGDYVDKQDIDDWRLELVAVTIMRDGLAKVRLIPL